MYQVIARKYRPQSFADVVNQEHVKTTLENAIAQNRIAHGYIFSGQRGTGKTTVARILARCLNCINGPTPLPCGTCASCLEIEQGGGAVDVIEIDAASNRGINEMRELRENVRYRPARDRYKVFIIDEAHQITNEAFNALLKTIEEPPDWVVFVLCTTESHKIPATIASRCQHFSFRSVEFESLVGRIAWICEQEGIQADQESLAVLARAGEGSVRDSLSALDQAIACCGSQLRAADVRALLGGFSLESLYRVTEALSDGNTQEMLEIVDELERSGQNLQHFSRELSRYIRNLLVAKIGDTRLIAASVEERERLLGIAGGFSEEDLTRYLQLSLDMFSELQTSLQPRFHLELGLIRMVHAGRLTTVEEALAAMGPAPNAPKGSPVPPRPAPPKPSPPPARAAGPSPFQADSAKKAAAAPEAPGDENDWRQKLHDALVELGLPFTADAVAHASIAATAAELQFTVPKHLLLSMRAEELGKAVQAVTGKVMKVKVIAGQASAAATPVVETRQQPAEDDETAERAMANEEVQRFQRLFGGQVRTVRNLRE